MYSTILSVAIFGATVWGQASTSSAAASASASEGGSTITGTATTTIPTIGSSTNGPAELALSYCFPSSWSGIATDTPCYSMEVLNSACFYGPSVFITATATPTSNASPKDQQSCYCDEQNGVGFMYFEFMEGYVYRVRGTNFSSSSSTVVPLASENTAPSALMARTTRSSSIHYPPPTVHSHLLRRTLASSSLHLGQMQPSLPLWTLLQRISWAPRRMSRW